jgi:hypothetical protein
MVLAKKEKVLIYLKMSIKFGSFAENIENLWKKNLLYSIEW